MQKNKFTTYILYALGEIVLVVIGIVIAVQIGNWNERRKAEGRIVIQKKALVNELYEDINALEKNLALVEEGLKKNLALVTRLSAPNATVDTLIKIYRYEYEVFNNDLPILSKTTFNSLEATGQISFLNDSLANQLLDYYTYRANKIRIMQGNAALYLDLIITVGLVAVPDKPNVVKGPLRDVNWENADTNWLSSRFQGMLSFRIFQQNLKVEMIKGILAESHKTIQVIESSE